MDFQLNDEQRQLSDSLERLLNQQYGIEQRKAFIESDSGFSPAFWSRLADLGILSLPVSEAAGGFGGGAVDLMRPMTLLGQALVVEPVLAQLVALRLLDQAATGTGTAADRSRATEVLQEAMTGERRLAWVSAAPGAAAGLVASATDDGWEVSGTVPGVIGALGAQDLLVSASLSGDTAGSDTVPAGGEVGLFLLPADTPSLNRHGGRALDNQRIADVSFDKVVLAQRQLLARGATASGAIEDAADFASALLCSEAVGVIDFSCQATLEYLKTRKQFGTTIGSFQALQHRIVDLHVELEQVRSMAALACSKYDAAANGQVSALERIKAIAAARVLIARAATKVAQESVQLHGGMGMAEEMKISHAFRRLTVLAQQSGNHGYFLDRFITADRQL